MNQKLKLENACCKESLKIYVNSIKNRLCLWRGSREMQYKDPDPISLLCIRMVGPWVQWSRRWVRPEVKGKGHKEAYYWKYAFLLFQRMRSWGSKFVQMESKSVQIPTLAAELPTADSAAVQWRMLFAVLTRLVGNVYVGTSWDLGN
jgi:hypothetical protein